MKYLRRLLTLVALLPIAASAQTYTVECGKSAPPTDVRLFNLALKERVRANIDTNLYDNILVSTRFRRSALNTSPITTPIETVLAGTNLVNAQPAGIGFAVTGTFEFETVCRYSYRVTITTRVRNKSSGDVLRARTESEVEVVSRRPFRVRSGS